MDFGNFQYKQSKKKKDTKQRKVDIKGIRLSFKIGIHDLDFRKKQAEKFLQGKSPPDFAPEDYEINYKNRATINDLTELGKKQLSL